MGPTPNAYYQYVGGICGVVKFGGGKVYSVSKSSSEKKSSGFLSCMWMDPKSPWAPDSPRVWIWYDVWHGTVALRYTLVTVDQSQTLKIDFPEHQC